MTRRGLETADLAPIAIILCAAIGLWCWGNRMAAPASDEVFSALNVAGIHPFQGVSYYMLPNNHLCFNLLNNLIFHPVADKVFTGRLLSLVAYIAVIIVLYYWLQSVLANRWLALLCALTAGLQFQVWGFGFQARGYELYLLAEWGLIVSLFRHISTGEERWLRLMALCSVTGFFCLPSFLYLYAAVIVFMALRSLIKKNRNARFWEFQLITIGITYLCYVPALCFSGLESITHNNYVSAMGAFKKTGHVAFAQWMFPFFKPYIIHLFSDVHWNNLPVNVLLFVLPAFLAFHRKNRTLRLAGLFYATLWPVFFLITIIMEKLPFERNLIGHYSFTYAALLLLAWWLTDLLAAAGRMKMAKWVLFTGVIVFFGIHFSRTNLTYLKDTLYEYDVNAYYKDKAEWLSNIPVGSTVAISDEDFYSYFLCLRLGYKAARCPAGNEDYFVKEAFEEIPQTAGVHYVLYKKLYGNEIWKRQ